MTIPIEDGTPAGVLDIRHHYFEFIPEDQADRDEPETVEAAELIEGRNYFILLTTAGGLYRYQIHDLVRCVGFHGKAPLIEFLNKGAHFSSLTGEKLSEYQVVAAVEAAQHEVGLRLRSYLLLPSWGEPPYYSLLVEEDDLTGPEAADRLAGAGRGAAPGPQRRVRQQAGHPPTRPSPHHPTARGFLGRIPEATAGAERGNRRTI